MKDLFSYKSKNGQTLGEIIFRPVKEHSINFTVVDIGARNGMFLLPKSYALFAKYIGFEPNQEEYEKLIKHGTDAMKQGMDMPKFKSEEYHDCAIWREDGNFPFYITKGPGACTLMGKTDTKVTSRMFLKGDAQSYETTHSEIQRTVTMKCKRLDAVLDPKRKIDFLKIDVEGADFAVLKGAQSLLKNKKILFIRSEFQLLPFYDNHYLLGDQQLFLNELGYRLIGCDWEHPRYTRDKSELPEYADKSLQYAGDSFFMLDPDRTDLSAEDRYRLALISLIFGFNSLAVSLLKETGFFSASEINKIVGVIRKRYAHKRWLHCWQKIPFSSLAILAKILKYFK